MLGIWEYFWDILDWTAPVTSPVNLCQVTATVSTIDNETATIAQLTIKTGRM